MKTLIDEELVIDEELRTVVPALTNDEYSKLETSVTAEGCRDSIIVWQNTIIDGYNRYEICQRHNIPFGISERHFADRDETKGWIILNQLGRRNLGDYNRGVLALLLKDNISAKAKAKQATSTGGAQPQLLESLPEAGPASEEAPVNTREEVAKIANVSGRTLDKIETIQEKGSEELKQAVRQEKVSISAAAAIAELPESEQRQVLELSDADIIKKAREVFTHKKAPAKKKKVSVENVNPQDLVSIYRIRIKEVAGEIKKAVRAEPAEMVQQIRKAIVELSDIVQDMSPSDPSNN